MTCEFDQFDGVYVLGALSPAERQEFVSHMSLCTRCARSVRELAGLPGLLSRLDLDAVETPGIAEPVPDTLLPSLVREVRRSQRRRLAGLAATGLAAAAVVAVTSLAVGGMVGDGSEGDATRSPTASVRVTPERSMTQVGQSRLHASVAMEDVAWGTKLSLTCTYESGGRYGDDAQPAYALVVTTRDGATEQVASWRAVPGGTMKVSGASASASTDIASVEVRTTQGEAVLRLTV